MSWRLSILSDLHHLRNNDILRLRLGCVRWQREDSTVSGTGELPHGDAVCLLDVPVNKTGVAFTKPVDRLVGEAVATSEKVTPTRQKAPRLEDWRGRLWASMAALLLLGVIAGYTNLQ